MSSCMKIIKKVYNSRLTIILPMHLSFLGGAEFWTNAIIKNISFNKREYS